MKKEEDSRIQVETEDVKTETALEGCYLSPCLPRRTRMQWWTTLIVCMGMLLLIGIAGYFIYYYS